ncbi:serine protease family S54 [Achlya hypogyna]|uniref:Serine protease family S54 n=1 Tax=Achlya hypogyna TaxID=1202772 RepID=A0A1V9YWL9_ACHHY|nr:serine protease family S54 [Achlya hypogyna]
MLSRLVRLERAPHHGGLAIALRSATKSSVTHRALPRRHPHVQADTTAFGLGFVALGIAVTAAPDLTKMSLLDVLGDSVHVVAAKMRETYGDDNRRILLQLIATNSVVFGLWNLSAKSPRLAMFMWHNFACSYQGVAVERRWHTLLTSAFSHITLTHFGVNMLMLWHFGSSILPPADEDGIKAARRFALTNGSWFESVSRPFGYRPPRSLTPTEFTTVYFTSAIASSVTSAVVSGVRGARFVYSIGASGAVFGILTAYCMMRPDQELYLYGMLPLTASDMLKVSVAVNGIGSIFQHAQRSALAMATPNVDFVGHLGGQAAAYVVAPK